MTDLLDLRETEDARVYLDALDYGEVEALADEMGIVPEDVTPETLVGYSIELAGGSEDELWPHLAAIIGLDAPGQVPARPDASSPSHSYRAEGVEGEDATYRDFAARTGIEPSPRQEDEQIRYEAWRVHFLACEGEP